MLLRICTGFKGVSFRETHLWEHFGRTDQIALITCLKKLNVSAASLKIVRRANSRRWEKNATAITERYGECSEALVFFAGKRGRKMVRTIKTTAVAKYYGIQCRTVFSTEGSFGVGAPKRMQRHSFCARCGRRCGAPTASLKFVLSYKRGLFTWGIIKGTKWQTKWANGFLQNSAVSCGFLRKSVPPKRCNSQEERKSAKIRDNQRISAKNCEFGSVCPIQFVPFNSPWFSLRGSLKSLKRSGEALENGLRQRPLSSPVKTWWKSLEGFISFHKTYHLGVVSPHLPVGKKTLCFCLVRPG